MERVGLLEDGRWKGGEGGTTGGWEVERYRAGLLEEKERGQGTGGGEVERAGLLGSFLGFAGRSHRPSRAWASHSVEQLLIGRLQNLPERARHQ